MRMQSKNNDLINPTVSGNLGNMNHINVKINQSIRRAVPLMLIALLSNFSAAQSDGELLNATLNQYCLACHNDTLSTADVSFQNIDLSDLSAHGALPEKVLSQLRNRRMPPMEMPKPAEDTYNQLVQWLETEIDNLASNNPNPGLGWGYSMPDYRFLFPATELTDYMYLRLAWASPLAACAYFAIEIALSLVMPHVHLNRKGRCSGRKHLLC